MLIFRTAVSFLQYVILNNFDDNLCDIYVTDSIKLQECNRYIFEKEKHRDVIKKQKRKKLTKLYGVMHNLV